MSATFHVVEPTEPSQLITIRSGQVHVLDNRAGKYGTFRKGRWYLACGSDFKPFCVDFNVSTTAKEPDNYHGAYQWVQLIHKYTETYTAKKDHKSHICQELPITAHLDSVYPYDFGKSTNDNPGIGLFPDDLNPSVDFQATMYLMWKANFSDAIYVPLASVDWMWKGSASVAGKIWKLTPGTVKSPKPIYHTGAGYPIWSAIGQFSCS